MQGRADPATPRAEAMDEMTPTPAAARALQTPVGVDGAHSSLEAQRTAETTELRQMGALSGCLARGPNGARTIFQVMTDDPNADGSFFFGLATAADPVGDVAESGAPDDCDDSPPDAAADEFADGASDDDGAPQSITTEQLDREFALFFASELDAKVLMDSFGIAPVSGKRHRFLVRVDADGTLLDTNALQFENIKELMAVWYADNPAATAAFRHTVASVGGNAAALAIAFEQRRRLVNTREASNKQRQAAVVPEAMRRQPKKTTAHAIPTRVKRLLLNIRKVFLSDNPTHDPVGVVKDHAPSLTGLAGEALFGLKYETVRSASNLDRWETQVASEGATAATLRLRRSTMDAPGTIGGALVAYLNSELRHKRAVRRCDMTNEATRLFAAANLKLPTNFVDRWMGRNNVHAFNILRKTSLSPAQVLERLRSLHTFVDNVWASAEAAKRTIDMVFMFDEVPFCYSGTESFKCLSFDGHLGSLTP